MRTYKFWQSTVCVMLLVSLSAIAQADVSAMETGWMELVEGTRDDASGAELVEIEDGDTSDTQKITLAIPKSAIANPDQIEEVIVIGMKPEAQEKPEPVEFTYEWVSDYDSDNYGLVIRLGKNTNWPIRLYMNSDPGFTR